jgi:putative Holliday junction resolvase
MGKETPTGRVLGIDLGRKRIGVAVSDHLRLLAHPLPPLSAGPRSSFEIAQIAKQYGCDTIVVGLPLGLGGVATPETESAKARAQEIQRESGARVLLWDERLSTREATRRLDELGIRGKQSRDLADSAAATIILQSYLDSRNRPSSG